MLETFRDNSREIGNSVDNSGVAEIVEYKTVDEHKISNSIPTIIMGDTDITDNDLKYTPKSEFINNAEVLNIDEVLRMNDAERAELLMKLQKQNLEIRKDNEQFRQKNFILMMEARKMKKMGANDDA